MKLGALKQGDKFRYPGQVSGYYIMYGEVPGTNGANCYVQSSVTGYVYSGSKSDDEVERIGNINDE